ncbi:MAG TPA: LamG domain-containing protein [Gammaproteobacteria bacterium]
MKYRFPLISIWIVTLLFLIAAPAQAAVSFRAASSAGVAGGGTITVTTGSLADDDDCGDINPSIPLGNVGDLLIAQVVARRNAATVSMSGWNILYSDNVPGEDYQAILFYRSATNTAADTNTINQSGSDCDLLAARITRFGGIDTAQPLELTASNAVYSNADNVDTGTQAVNVANSLLVLATFVADNRNVTQPVSFTELYDDDVNNNDDGGISLNYRVQATTGTQGPFNNMLLSGGGGGDPNHGVLFAVRPAPAQTLTINVPTGTITDDVMIASIAVRPSTVNITAPAGWTLIRLVDQSGGNSNRLATYYRVADGSEPASYTWTFTGATHTGAVGGIASFSGVDTATPIDSEAGQATAADTNHTAPGVTTTVTGGMLVTVHEFSSAVTWAPPGGMTEAIDVASLPTPDTLGLSMEMNYEQRSATGATGTRTATAASDADVGATQSVALLAIPPPPLTPGSCETFESGLGNWIIDASGGGDAGIGSATSNSPSNSLYTRWNVVSVASTAVDFQSSTAARITAWIQRGDNGFSEIPDVGEDLVIEYFNNSSAWVTLETFPGGGTAGEIFIRAYDLPADALHNNFQIRFRQTGGTGNSTNDFDYWHIDDVCFLAGLSISVAYYDMEELAWDGTAGEVADGSGNGLNGQSNNGAFTDNTNPAIAGDPGTCRYGVFDGADDYLEVADNALLDIGSELTVATWVKVDALPPALTTIVSKDENFEFHLTDTGQVNWWWQNSGGTARQITTAGNAIDPGLGWHHVAIVYSQSAGSQTIYVNGAVRGTAAFSEALMTNADPLQIGADQNFAGRYFDGQIDEVYIYNRALSAADINTLMNQTHSCAGGIRAYYAMDEASWNGTPGEITDSSGNGNHANRVGGVDTDVATPAWPNDPGTCRYGEIPDNGGTGTFDAVDTALVPGDAGAITFWYRSNTDWGDEDQMLLDASVDLGGGGADKYFYLVKRDSGGGGDLRFRLEDSTDDDSEADTPNFGFGANTWVHIGLTWDIPGEVLEIYVNGVLEATSTANLDGDAAAWNSLYLGDNRTEGVGGADYTGNSANGLIDEVRIYDGPISQAVVQADMNATHPCNANHFRINHDGTAVTCQAEPVTIIAHMVDHSIDGSYAGLLNLSTSTGRGDWTLVNGNGAVVNGAANDGAATYNMVLGDNGQVILGLKNTTVETVNLGVTDGTISETTGTATAAEDPNLAFAETGFIFLGDGAASNIGTQIAGKPSDVAPGVQVLELQAVRTSDQTGACEAALAGNVDVELAFECEDPGACTANQVVINSTAIAGNNAGPIAAYTPVTLDFGDATDSTATFVLNYPDAGQIQLHARYNMPLDDGSNTPSGNYMIGASNTFVTRPFGIHVNVPGNPGATGSGGGAFIGAGNNFTIDATAVIWEAADDANSDGIPDGHESADTDPSNNADLSNNAAALNFGQEAVVETVALGALLDQPAGGNSPALQGGITINSFTNGAGGTTTARYGEVGIIEITASVSNYLGAGSVIGKSGYVGRFIPDHFSLSAGGVTHRFNESCAPASAFTYMDEVFQVDFGLTAENSGNVTTQNYTGAFAMLDLGAVGSLNLGAVDTAGPTALSARLVPGSSAGAWTSGVANIVTATASLARDTAPDGPYPSLVLGAAPVDPDGVGLGSFDLDVDLVGGNDHAQVATVEARYGRMFLENAYGSELLPLTLPLYAEYWNGSQFLRNTDDSCTDYAFTDLSFGNRQGLSAGQPAANGNGTLLQGSYDSGNPIQLNSNGEVGSVDATLNVPPYLHFDWDNNAGTADTDPTSKATFGVFDGTERQIYIREVY